jgi:hypothetical protein
MKRLFVGLTLLLMAFLSTLDHFDRLHQLAARVGIQRWMTEAVLAVAIVALFVRASELNRRLLFPRRGLKLLLAGIVVYGLGVAVATGALVGATGALQPQDLGPLADLPRVATRLTPWPLFFVADVLLVIGVFRALTNLVPPDEFAEDF